MLGLVSQKGVGWIGSGLAVLGLLLILGTALGFQATKDLGHANATRTTALMLLTFIVAYDLHPWKEHLTGVALMVACRVTNVLLGTLAVSKDAVAMLAVTLVAVVV